MEDIVTKCYKIVSWHVRFFLKEIDMSQDKKIKLDMSDISKLVCLDTIIDAKYSEEICRNLKNIFSNKGIDATIEEYDNGEKFLIMRKGEITIIDKCKRAKYSTRNKDKEKNFSDIIKDHKLYDEETRYLLCPECNRYSVEYSTSSYDKNDKKWWCNNCLDVIIYRDYNLDISDKDKYNIYKLWGVEALSIFIDRSMKKTIGFIASYFKNSCVAKKDKCLYFDFFKEKDKKDKKDEKDKKDGRYNVEGDVVDERNKMDIVRRDARGE